MSAQREYLKSFQVPASRWVLPMWNHSHFGVVYVDEPGSCAGQHIMCYGMYHRYQDEQGRLYVVRCPERLSWNEKQSLVQDVPEGSWEEKLASRKVERLSDEARLRRLRAEEEKRGR